MLRTIRLTAALLTLGAAAARAQTITDGFTFAVASSGGSCAAGTHFHSNTGGAFGNPAGKAEVGNFSSECVRGLSEYNLSGLTTSPTAFVTFNVFKAGGLFTGTNDFPFNGNINVVAYQGNNLEDISDYEAPSLGTVGSFNTTGLPVGGILSFDITSLFNTAIMNGATSFGIRLERADEDGTNRGAYTFDTFRLTSNNQSTVVTTPEPVSLVFLVFGLGGAGLVQVRRRARR